MGYIIIIIGQPRFVSCFTKSTASHTVAAIVAILIKKICIIRYASGTENSYPDPLEDSKELKLAP